MFTGIVEEVGCVTGIEQRGENRRITIAAENAPKELKAGHSSGVSITQLVNDTADELAFLWNETDGKTAAK